MSNHQLRLHSLSTGALATALCALMLTPALGVAQAPASASKAAPAVKLPVSAADHLAKAEEYAKKAAGYREEAAYHRTMLEEYKKTVVTAPAGKAPENPYLVKMRAHCEGYIKGAEAMAADADKFAEYHRLRAAELKGK